jgi:hypothetical protein
MRARLDQENYRISTYSIGLVSYFLRCGKNHDLVHLRLTAGRKCCRKGRLDRLRPLRLYRMRLTSVAAKHIKLSNSHLLSDLAKVPTAPLTVALFLVLKQILSS